MKLSGEGNPRAKLTNELVIKIKSMYLLYNLTPSEIANILNVSKRSIQHICHGDQWKKVTIENEEKLRSLKTNNKNIKLRSDKTEESYF